MAKETLMKRLPNKPSKCHNLAMWYYYHRPMLFLFSTLQTLYDSCFRKMGYLKTRNKMFAMRLHSYLPYVTHLNNFSWYYKKGMWNPRSHCGLCDNSCMIWKHAYDIQWHIMVPCHLDFVYIIISMWDSPITMGGKLA